MSRLAPQYPFYRKAHWALFAFERSSLSAVAPNELRRFDPPVKPIPGTPTVAESDTSRVLCFPLRSGLQHRKPHMPSLSVLRFRRPRKQPHPATASTPRPGSPDSFVSPGSPAEFSPRHSPIELRRPHADHDGGASFLSLSSRAIRRPPALDVDFNFNASFSVSDLFLAPGASGMSCQDGSDGAGEALQDGKRIEPSHQSRPSEESILTHASTRSTGLRRPAPAPLRIPNGAFRATALTIVENSAESPLRPNKTVSVQAFPSKPVVVAKPAPAGGGRRASSSGNLTTDSAHSSSLLPDHILSSVFVIAPDRRSNEYAAGHARQDSATLPTDTPGMPPDRVDRNSRSPVLRRTSMPALGPTPVTFDSESKGRPLSALSPRLSMKNIFHVQDHSGSPSASPVKDNPGRPLSKPLPVTPEESPFSSTRGPSISIMLESAIQGDDGTAGSSGTSTFIDLEARSVTTPPTSELSPGPPSLSATSVPSKSGWPVRGTLPLSDVPLTPSHGRTFLETVPELSTSSTARSVSEHPIRHPSPDTRQYNHASPNSPRFPHMTKAKPTAVPHMALPIGVSDVASRSRSSTGGSITDQGREGVFSVAQYGVLPPSTFITPAPTRKPPSPPLPKIPHRPAPLLIARPTPDNNLPLKRTVSRSSSKGRIRKRTGSEDLPSPPVLVANAPRRESSAFPQTPRAFTPSPESSPRQLHPPLPVRHELHGDLAAAETASESSSAQVTPRSSTRRPGRGRPALPIGPRNPPLRATSQRPSHTSGACLPGTSPPFSKGSIGHNGQPMRPYSPTFASPSVPWKGLTLEAAQWTFTSDQLQEIVGRAIRCGADTSHIRLLNPDTLDSDIPEAEDRLEARRDQFKINFRLNSRRRRMLFRELANSTDLANIQKFAAELADVNVVCDQLVDEIYLVTEQLAQLNRLRDAHSSSALSLALRKLNSSLIRSKASVLEHEARAATLQAERDEAWAMAESVEAQLNEMRQQLEEMSHVGISRPVTTDGAAAGLVRSASGRLSRVSAARKASLRVSKASLRLSTPKSARSSSSSVRYASIVWSRPASDPVADEVPPVPPVPTNVTSVPLSPAYGDLFESGGSDGRRAPSSAYLRAQSEVYELLGLQPSHTPKPLRRARSMSDCPSSALPGSARFSPVNDSPAESSVGRSATLMPSPPSSWKLEQPTRTRRSFSIHGTTLMFPGGRQRNVLEDPESKNIIALLQARVSPSSPILASP